MPSATPADVLARRRELTLNGDAEGIADLFAPNAVIEFAFHGPDGDRHHDGPGAVGDVYPAPPDPGRSDRALA